MKKDISKNMEIPNHRADLADIIIEQSRHTKQDSQIILFVPFAAKFGYGFTAFLILVTAFFFGFNQGSNKYSQQLTEQKSVVEEIYYSNFTLL